MPHEFSRTELLIGKDALKKLKNATVTVFGIGGVGSYAVEGLVRSGIGNLVLVDDDLICLTNINRQIHANRKTVGRPKVEVMKDRILEINPKARVETFQTFYLPDCGQEIIKPGCDYIIDAIDTVTAKIDIVVQAGKLNIPVISCMGTGKKLDPTRFEVTDLFKTSVCPLCKVMRKELKDRGINALTVVYSSEAVRRSFDADDGGCNANCVCPKGGSIRKCTSRRDIPGSISFVPSVAGLIAASHVVRELIGDLKPPDPVIPPTQYRRDS